MLLGVLNHYLHPFLYVLFLLILAMLLLSFVIIKCTNLVTTTCNHCTLIASSIFAAWPSSNAPTYPITTRGNFGKVLQGNLNANALIVSCQHHQVYPIQYHIRCCLVLFSNDIFWLMPSNVCTKKPGISLTRKGHVCWAISSAPCSTQA